MPEDPQTRTLSTLDECNDQCLAGAASSSAGKERMRIAYIVHTFETGGLERCVARLLNHLDRHRFEPCLICLNRNGSAANWVEMDDVPVFELNKRSGNQPLVVQRLARVLREQQVDLVHSHNWGTLVETDLARRWANVPIHVHAERGTVLGSLERRGMRAWLRARVTHSVLQRVDAIVAVSESVQARLAEVCRLPSDSIQVISNGVDVPRLEDPLLERRTLRRQLGISEGSIVIGSVGRLVRVKDFGNAVTALGHLVRDGVDVHLLLVGDGPFRETLEDQAKAAGVSDRLHLVGQQQNIASWLSAMDLYVNSSLSEGMSQAILEAMATGLPLVVTDVGENARLAGGDDACGLVIPPGDSPALADAVKQLAADSARRAELARRATERHRFEYSTKRMLSVYEQLYLERYHAFAAKG